MKELSLPALNVQAPWAQLIVGGKKTVETRFYPLPKAYVGKKMFVVETPGKDKAAKRRVVGTVVFSGSFEYQSRKEFYKDSSRHLVDEKSEFAWDAHDTKKKWGWTIQTATPIDGVIAGDQKIGILYTRLLRVRLLK